MFKYNYSGNRIVAIGDIHADYELFVEILKMAGVIDSKLNWIGKSTYVVQLGDLLDGKRPDVVVEKKYKDTPGEIKLFQLVLELDSKAKRHNGRVISILGNHELFPYYFSHDLRTMNQYIKMVDRKEYEKVYKMKRHIFYKPGNMGAKILGATRPYMLQLGEFIFCHGSLTTKFLKACVKNGLTKKNGKIDIQKINILVADWLKGKIKTPFFIDFDDDANPLLNRELTDPDFLNSSQCRYRVNKILSYFDNAKYIVMGHSTQKRINSLCSNQIYRVDIAISRALGGTFEEKKSQLAFLEILNNDSRNDSSNVIINIKDGK